MSDNKTVDGEPIHPPFIKHGEDIARDVTGESADGEQMVLMDDCMIYFKLMAFEQGVLNRLRQYSDQNLQMDIDASRGFLYLGDIEAVRADLHSQIDNMFDAIAAHRAAEAAKETEDAK